MSCTSDIVEMSERIVVQMKSTSWEKKKPKGVDFEKTKQSLPVSLGVNSTRQEGKSRADGAVSRPGDPTLKENRQPPEAQLYAYQMAEKKPDIQLNNFGRGIFRQKREEQNESLEQPRLISSKTQAEPRVPVDPKLKYGTKPRVNNYPLKFKVYQGGSEVNAEVQGGKLRITDPAVLKRKLPGDNQSNKRTAVKSEPTNDMGHIPNHSLNESGPAEFTSSVKKERKTKALSVLSTEQEQIMTLVFSGKSFFFTGNAGTGKSFVLKELVKRWKKFGLPEDKYALTAATGVAAYNIGGCTLHSFAGIGLGKGTREQCVGFLKKSQQSVARWKNLKMLIIDEISMIEADYFDKLDFLARRIRNSDEPFGGIQVVLCGDFLQLPPPAKDAKYVFESEAWKNLKLQMVYLKKIYRQTEAVFMHILNELRLGKVSDDAAQLFKALEDNDVETKFHACTKLFPTRAEVEKENTTQLAKLGGTVRSFNAVDDTHDEKLTQKLNESLLAPAKLTLRVGASVMLIKNCKSLYNGAIGTVESFEDEGIVVKFKNSKVTLGREKFEIFRADKNPLAARMQFPIILAYAL